MRVVIYAEHTPDGWRVRLVRFTERQSFTDPAGPLVPSIDEVITRILDQGWGQVVLQTPESDVQILQKFTRGSLRRTVRSGRPSRTDWELVAQDRVKHRVLDPVKDARLLQVLDISDASGAIRSGMSDKYRQICHLIDIARQSIPTSEARILDAGCGKAYLSLALAYVLERDGCTVHLHGVDANPHVIDHCRRAAAEIGLSNATFQSAPIADTRLPWSNQVSAVDVVIALHACDTATDDALSLALQVQAITILAAPCCHHYVQKQLQRDVVPEWARPLLDDGITRERLGDLLTDTMRRDLLRWQGYAAHLEEFVSFEHTPKNILLRAVQANTSLVERERMIQRVLEMRQAWGVAPKLFELLKPSMQTAV